MMVDPKLLADYQGPQRKPVFTRRTPTPSTQKPFWPLLIYAALLGAALVTVATYVLGAI